MTQTTTSFLTGNSEMTALTRAKDWARTPVGAIEHWPQSLRTTLGIILNSKFPMFLWWGPELICFYNDAYRPSLGNNGKHPEILGMPAREAWYEIWDIIKPLIDQVMAGGEATWSENQLIPIFRNGKIEDVYWTFSYSAVPDESGTIAGVLVTCSETTENINTLKTLEHNNQKYLRNMMQAPVAISILRGPQFVVEIANELILQIWGKKYEDVINRPVFESLVEAKGQGLEELLKNVYETDEKFVGNEHPINLLRNGKIETTYINFVYEPLREDNGRISGIVVIASDVTWQVLARKKVEESEKRFRDTVKQVPLGITILNGPEFVVEMANETYLQIVDRKEAELVGKPLFDSLPEVREIVAPLLNGVLASGTAFHASELSVILNRYGKKELAYFNLVYHPMKDPDGSISGIIVVASEVTESVKAQQFLGESEKQFRKMVMQSPIAMTILKGNDYVIEIANEILFKQIWRKKEEDVIGRKILDVFPELREQKYAELLEMVYTKGHIHREQESEAYVQGDDGMRKFYFDYEYCPLFETNGEISGIMITVNDVTGRVENQQKVKDAEERLRLSTEATELSTWDLDLQTREIIHSPRLSEIFGHAKSKKILHQDMRDQIHPEDLGIVEKAYEKALKTSIYKYEVRIVKPEGQICWIRTQGKVFYDRNGKPLKMLGTLRDITDEKLHEQELLESEQKFRLLADSMPQHIWTADPAGNLNYYNQSVFNYSGMTPQEINTKGWLDIVHPEDRQENIKQWMQAVSNGDDFLFEHRFRRYDGQYRWQLSRATPQRDNDGNIQMWVGTSTDIQAQKTFTNELEKQVLERTRELEQKNSDLKKMNTELQSFAYVSSHDLQEPLRKIQIFAGRVMEKEYDTLSDTAKDYFGRMQKAANRMQTLIRDLLSYSRTNNTKEDFVTVNLNDVIQETTAEFAELIEESHAVIEIEGNCQANIIPFQFRQLMHNLIGNALKFSVPGRAPKVTVSCKMGSAADFGLDGIAEESTFTQITIADNGIGFDSQYQDQIFEVFKRLHGREEYSGTGIGLSIVKKIVEHHNGFISAEGTPNQGARFTVYIPV